MTRKSRAIRSIWKDELRKSDMNDQDKIDFVTFYHELVAGVEKTDPPKWVC